MSKSKKIFNIGLALLLNLTASSACNSSTVEANLSGAEVAIGKLANFKTFRIEPAGLEALIKGDCTKTKEIKTDYSVVSVYGCSPKSGINRVRMDWRNGNGDSHVMALSVDFNYTAYENVKKAMEQNLGRASKRLKDVVEWRSSSDKGLNEWGKPVIYVTRDSDTHAASFELALEQGP